MFRILVRKELLSHLRTLRWSVVFGCMVLLSALTGVVGSLDFSEAVAAYEKQRLEFGESQDRATVYGNARYNRYLPPQPVSILARGASSASGYVYVVRLNYKDPIPFPMRTDWSDRLLTLVRVDFATAVGLIGGLLALALGFDTMCGERARGTLSMLLSNSVSRATVVLAKLTGGWLVLSASIAVAFTLNLVIVCLNPDVSLQGDDWIRVGCIFALSCLYLATVFALSTLVSTLTAAPASSLIVCLFAWLAGSVGYANLLPSFSRYLVKERSIQDYRSGYEEMQRQYWQQVRDWEEQHPSPGPAYTTGLERNGVLRYAHPVGYDWLARRNEYMQDKNLEMTEKATELIWGITTAPHLNQALAAERWSVISPYTTYLTLTRYLARSSSDDQLHLGRVGMRYRDQVIDFLREHAFGDRRWFTDDPPGQVPMIADPESVTADMLVPGSDYMQERMLWAEQQEQEARRDPRRKLDRTADPVLPPAWKRSLTGSLGLALPGLAILALTCVAGVVLSIRRFQRYAVR